jgi:hypothetical protein
MKKILYTLVVTALFFLSGSEAPAQCDPESFTQNCIPKLSNGFNYLKSYKINGNDGAKDKVEYSYVFTKGTQYMINLCANGEGTDGIVVNLYDSNRNRVASSKVNGQFISAIAYPCNNTGIYYIQYTFDNSSAYCGGSALGFKR